MIDMETLGVVADVIVYGAEIYDSLGYPFATDLTGDGVCELILGASKADGPKNLREDAGEVYVLNGPFESGTLISMFDTIADITVYGSDGHDNFGMVFGSGDISADGMTDLLLGCPYGAGPSDARNSSGEVYALFRSSSPLPVPGEVSSGASGLPLLLEKGDTAADIYSFSWEDLGQVAWDYSIYEGTIGSFYSHEGIFCHAGVVRREFSRCFSDFHLAEGSRYYLVTASNSSGEGPAGYDRQGTERDPALNTCSASP
jgi:hypothetical protein